MHELSFADISLQTIWISLLRFLPLQVRWICVIIWANAWDIPRRKSNVKVSVSEVFVNSFLLGCVASFVGVHCQWFPGELGGGSFRRKNPISQRNIAHSMPKTSFLWVPPLFSRSVWWWCFGGGFSVLCRWCAVMWYCMISCGWTRGEMRHCGWLWSDGMGCHVLSSNMMCRM